MATDLEAVEQARQCHQAGYLQEAERRYREMLETAPLRPDVWFDLGVACHMQGKLDDAAASYEGALRVRPDHAQAHNNLGAVRAAQGRLDEAVTCYRLALQSQPAYADAYNNLGIALKAQGKLEEAAASFQQCLRLKSDYAEAHNNLGNVLRSQDCLEEAAACYRRALQLSPNSAYAHNNLGVALKAQGKLEEAAASLRQALALDPGHADALNNLGNVLRAQDRLEEAVASYWHVLQLRPDYAEANHNLGVALAAKGHPEEAVSSYGRALQLRPDYAEAHVGRALAWLLQGDFEAGWPEYEWRWKHKLVPRHFSQPRWDGTPQPGKSILLHAEQGLGDTIQFIRYAPLVKQRCGSVIVECQAPLAPLLRSCAGIDQLVAEGADLPPFDVHMPLLSLPLVLGTTLATVPADIPYLQADEQLVEQWRRDLSTLPGLKIGIAWQGSPNYDDDRSRSIPLVHFAPLAGLPNVTLISLQKGPGTEQLADIEFPVTDWSSRLDVNAGAFMDTAAIMKSLALVITSDSATAHLAGALRVPVWVALPYAPDFRWLLGRQDSPWYPTMQLFRQSKPGEWVEVFKRIAGELSRTRTCWLPANALH
jgi:tetratricopeptide (TPR) repeat protein